MEGVKTEWFETWFDSEYYHLLYNNRDDNEAETFINNLLKKLQLDKNSHILDLACGKGRHSFYLNQKGFKTTGVDLSENSIQSAKLFKNDSLNFEVRDMRFSFEKEEFDAIFNLFTSFGYFDSKTENLKVLGAIETMLKTNGVFVIDFMNAKKVVQNLTKNEIKTVGSINFNLNRSVENGNIIKRIEFSDNGNNFRYKEQVQALVLSDFEEMIQQTDLKIDAIFGSYNLDNFDKNTSDRLIIIGRKK